MNQDNIEILGQFNRGKLLYVTIDAETKTITSWATKTEATWDDFVASLPKDRCAYFLLDVQYVSTSDKVTRSKNGFGRWCPERATTRDKMNSTFFSKKFVSEIIPFVPTLSETRFQADSVEEVDREVIIERVTRFSYVK